MKRQLLWLILAIAATGCKDGAEETQLQPKTLTAAIYASGTLVPEQEYKVLSSVDGYLVKALVKEGDTVSEGQMLFEVNSDVRQAQEQGARALVQRTLPTVSDNAPLLQELKGRIEVARIKMQQDSLNYMRYKNLYEQDAISQSSYEKYYLQYQSSLKDYNNLRQQYQQQQLAGDIQLQQAQNQLTLAQAQTGVGNLKSFVNGIVYDVYKKEGDLVTPNQPVALIGAGEMYAKLMVDEDDLHKVYEGQKILVTMDAFPDKVFNAHIRKVYPYLSKVEQSFRVDAVLDEPVPVGMYGLNLEANIIIAENKEVMVLPKAALLKGDSVVVKDGKDTKKVKITKGIEDDEWVEIKSGIDKNTTVIIE